MKKQTCDGCRWFPQSRNLPEHRRLADLRSCTRTILRERSLKRRPRLAVAIDRWIYCSPLPSRLGSIADAFVTFPRIVSDQCCSESPLRDRTRIAIASYPRYVLPKRYALGSLRFSLLAGGFVCSLPLGPNCCHSCRRLDFLAQVLGALSLQTGRVHIAYALGHLWPSLRCNAQPRSLLRRKS